MTIKLVDIHADHATEVYAQLDGALEAAKEEIGQEAGGFAIVVFDRFGGAYTSYGVVRGAVTDEVLPFMVMQQLQDLVKTEIAQRRESE